jgi:hypothetical protein
MGSLKVYFYYDVIIWTNNQHVILAETFAALSSTRSNSDQVTALSEEEDSGTSDEVFFTILSWLVYILELWF